MTWCRLDRFLGEIEGAGIKVEMRRAETRFSGWSWWSGAGDAWPLMHSALESLGSHPRVWTLVPKDAGEIALILEAASRHGVCITPRGGGSGVLGAAWPRDCCVALSLEKLSWARVDPESQMVDAGAGTPLYVVEEEARRHGFTTGLEPQSIRVASVGGLVSTLGAGALQPGIGNIEDVVLYVETVLPGGETVLLGSPRRPRGAAPAGGPLLVAGGEGMLGVVTRVGLRLREEPKHVESATLRFPSMEGALRAARDLVQWNQPAILRVLDAGESALYGAQDYNMIVAYYDNIDPEIPRLLLRKAEAAASRHGGRRAEDVFEEWRKKRYSYMETIKLLHGAGLWFDTIDTQAVWSVLPALHREVHRALEGIEGVEASFSHASHFTPQGGSLYTTIAARRDPQVIARAWAAVLGTALRLGASTTHHHGIGLQKLYWVAREDPDLIAVLCRIKRALDPGRVLNSPGLASLCRRRV